MCCVFTNVCLACACEITLWCINKRDDHNTVLEHTCPLCNPPETPAPQISICGSGTDTLWISSIYFMVNSTALEQPCQCPSASEATLKTMGYTENEVLPCCRPCFLMQYIMIYAHGSSLFVVRLWLILFISYGINSMTLEQWNDCQVPVKQPRRIWINEPDEER